MSQISHGTITISDLTDITDVYLQYGLALANATVTNSYSFSGTGEVGWNTTYPIWQSGYQIWIRQVTEKEGLPNEYGTPYLDTAVNQLNTTISAANANITALQTRTKKIWVNLNNSTTYPAGTYAASGINNGEVTENNSSTYGYNTFLTHNKLALRYNAIDMAALTTNILTFYTPTQDSNNNWIQGEKGVELSTDGLILYNPAAIAPNNKGLELNANGLYLYKPLANGEVSQSTAAQLTSTGLTLIKGGIQAGTAGQNGFIYLSSEDYPKGVNGITINNHTPDVESPAWREIIGTKFGVDSEGNLYANSANLSNANIEGAITATSLTIGGGASSYDAINAMNAAGYTIEIINDISAAPIGTIITDGSTYLYPIMYHNGVRVGGNEIINTQYTWYRGSSEIGEQGDASKGGIVANYGYTYRVAYSFDDGEVGQAPSVQQVLVDPQKYITRISDTGITIHPEDTSGHNFLQINANGFDIVKNNSVIASYGTDITIGSTNGKNIFINSNGIQIRNISTILTRFETNEIQLGTNNASRILINTNGLTIYKDSTDVAQFGSTTRIGASNSARFLINNNSLQAYDNSATPIKYFEVNSTGLSWGNNVAATTAQVNAAALVADNYLTNITGGGVYIHSADTPSDASSANAKGIQISDNLDIIRNGVSIASYGTEVRIGDENEIHIIIDNNSLDIKDSDGLGLATFGNDYLSIGAVPTDSYETLLGKKWAIIDSNGFKVQGKAEFAPFRTYLLGGIAESAAQKMAEYIDEDVNTLWSHYLSYAPISGTTITILFSPTGSTSFTAGVAKTDRGIIYDGVRTFQNTTWTSSGEPDESGLVPAGWEHVASGRVTYITYESSEATAGTYIFVGVHDDQYQHGDGSALFGTNLIGQKECQTVIGRYNNNSTSNVFEIGNGSSSTRSNALTVNWNGNTTIAGTLTQSSDRRLKNHKSYLSNDAIEFIRELKPAYFIKDEQSHVGFYAQDVEEIDSWGCMVGEMNGYKTLGYTELIAPLVTYCQHLEKRITELETQFEGGID